MFKLSPEFPRFFSSDSAKAIKAAGYGYYNCINYMAPATSAGVGNLCSHFSKACFRFCLGITSGQAGMVGKEEGATNPVRESRKRKARFFMQRRAAYMLEMCWHIAREYKTSLRLGLTLCVRPNGSTDIAYEGLKFEVDSSFAAWLTSTTGHAIAPGKYTIFSLFHWVQFVDYTKNPNRMTRTLPPNYCLTFSRSEENETQARDVLANGGNVAIIFADAKPQSWFGFTVIDGDKHDLRHLDPRGAIGTVIGLSPKGRDILADTSGFMLRT